jgi:uncharacterized protein (DUF1800 family)
VNRASLALLCTLVLLISGCATALTGGGGTGGGGTGPFVLTVTPATASIHGVDTQQFAATASDGSSPAVNWSVNGVAGGNATTGTISATGLYSSPEFPPSPNTITITAAETADATKTGASNVTLMNPIPQVTSAAPTSIPVGAFTLVVTGAHFAQGATVYFGTVALTTTRVSSTQLTAVGTATSGQVGNISITVQNPNPGAATSGQVMAQVIGGGIVVTVTPNVANVRTAATQQFSASVTGSSNTGVTWAVNGIPGGNDSLGTIIGNGNYNAPATLPLNNAITVTATSIADTTKAGTAAVTLQNPVPTIVSVTPPALTVGAFTLNIIGTNFVNGAVVKFGSTALTTSFVSSTQLTASGTATAAQAGNVPVTVTNPNPGSAVSNAVIVVLSVPNSNIKVTISPTSASLVTGASQQFTATVTGTPNTAVTWSVAGQINGNTEVGTIDTTGLFIAPLNIPSPNSVLVTATSVADSTKMASATVTFLNPPPVLTSISPAKIAPGTFEITLNGTGFVNTSTATFGGVALTVIYGSPNSLLGIGSVTAAQAGNVPVVVTNPAPGGGVSAAVNVLVTTAGTPITSAAAVRFLEQSTFGPTPETMNQLQQLGYDLYLQNELTATTTPYPDPIPNSSVFNVQQRFFVNSFAGGDQLRQRSALALNELWVVAGDKISDPLGYTNYLRTLDKDALGNYLSIMTDVTLTPAMGNYLDMVNNDAPAPGQHANENYAREIMQLFTLGLNQLNPDGTPVLDGSGNPLPTYTQDDVMALGRVFTGWTYPVEPGKSAQKHNPQYYGGPMVAVESNHDSGAKTLLGQTIPAGQTAEADLASALNIIFNHPNVGPFVARQYILRLVTSNPSPAYVQRVAQAFNTGSFSSGTGATYGAGTRGDMQALLAAVLLDPEARRGDDPSTVVATDGKLREPIVMEVSLIRAFHAQTDAGGLSNEGDDMGQNVFYPATVFNFFPPVSPIPNTTLNGPEFAIFNTATSLSRVNFIDDVVYGAVGANTHFNFAPVINAGSQDAMLSWLGTLFLHGPVPDTMKTTIETALSSVNPADTTGQARGAIYLVTSSSMYQVQH